MVAGRTVWPMRPLAVALALLGAVCGALLLTQTFAATQTSFGTRAPATHSVMVGGRSSTAASSVHAAMKNPPASVIGAPSGAGIAAQHGTTRPAQPIVRAGGSTVMSVQPGDEGPPQGPGPGGCTRCM